MAANKQQAFLDRLKEVNRKLFNDLTLDNGQFPFAAFFAKLDNSTDEQILDAFAEGIIDCCLEDHIIDQKALDGLKQEQLKQKIIKTIEDEINRRKTEDVTSFAFGVGFLDLFWQMLGFSLAKTFADKTALGEMPSDPGAGINAQPDILPLDIGLNMGVFNLVLPLLAGLVAYSCQRELFFEEFDNTHRACEAKPTESVNSNMNSKEYKQKRQEAWNTSKVRKDAITGASMLAVKCTAAMAGWNVAYYFIVPLLLPMTALDGGASMLLSALLIGATQALFTMVTNAIMLTAKDMMDPKAATDSRFYLHKLAATFLGHLCSSNSLKLGLSCILAGGLFSIIGQLLSPFMMVASETLVPMIAMLHNALVSSAAVAITGLAASMSFLLMGALSGKVEKQSYQMKTLMFGGPLAKTEKPKEIQALDGLLSTMKTKLSA